MSELAFPFWLVLAFPAGEPPAPIPFDRERAAPAFNSSRAAILFLQAQREGRWDVRLVPQRDFKSALVDLLQAGYHAIRLNPDSHGAGGRVFTLVELEGLCK